MVESFGSERSIDDVLAGRLRVTLGGKEYILPVRSIASNRRWVESLDAEEGALLAAVESAGDDLKELGRLLTTQMTADQLIDLVIAYDEGHVLPSKAELEEVTKPHEALLAVTQIRQVQNPLADAGLVLLAKSIAGTLSPEPTSSPPPNGASKRRRPLKVA